MIPAVPSRVYAVIADYRRHHPHIVPPDYFRKVEVVAGGVGAGTRIHVEMRVMGTTRSFDHVVTEPEPGRLLVESDVDGSSVTTFTVDPADGGQATHLTIATEVVARPGISGALERRLSSWVLGRIYREQIARVAKYLEGSGEKA